MSAFTVPTTLLPYGRQWLDEDDVAAVTRVLRSDWLTTGPIVDEFERAFADFTGTAHAVAVCNGTAALHAATAAIGVGPGDEVIVPAITFVATANAVLYQGATPRFADVDPDTLLIDPADVERRITPRTKAILAVDYAGQPCDYERLRDLARRNNLALLADACHALGGTVQGRPVGGLVDLSTFSLHPVKPITAGEGGVITTNDTRLAQAMRIFRNHGISSDFRQRERQGSWAYEMVSLGYNYRLSDIHCALALSQLAKLPAWVTRRQAIARRYDAAFSGESAFRPLVVRAGVSHAYHLYVIRLRGGIDRGAFFQALRAEGIGANVHYAPVHLHPYYREHLGGAHGLCPEAERAASRIITLPLFPRMNDDDVEKVISATLKVAQRFDGNP